MCVQLQYNNDFLKIIDSEEKPKYISKNERENHLKSLILHKNML